MHASSILMLLSWPIIIVISWFIIKFTLGWYEKKQAKLDNNGEKDS